MTQHALTEQFYVIEHGTGALRRVDTAPLPDAAPKPDAVVAAAPSRTREPGRALGRATRSVWRAAVYTARAVGAIVGIIIASMTVALLVALQRLIHLG